MFEFVKEVLRKRRVRRLHHAIVCGDNELFETCIDAEIVNVVNRNGRTPLEVATLCRNPYFMYKLIQWGASVDCGETLDTDPLFMSCYYGWTEVLRLILRSDSVRYKTRTKYSAKQSAQVTFGVAHMCAISHRPRDVLVTLLDHGVDVVVPDSNGCTLLHHAVKKEAPNMAFFEIAVRVFSNHNMIDARNRRGYTALEYALIQRHVDAAKLLLQHGASPHVTRYTNQSLSLLLLIAPERDTTVKYIASLLQEPVY